MAKAQIQKGSQGSVVKEWQEYLIEKGYDLGTGGADGIFGDMTDAATRKYQKDMGLDVDGIVGNNTWGSMDTGSGSSEGTGYKYETSPFTTSEDTNNAWNNYNSLAKPDALDPTYWAAVQAAQDKINNREKFSYDLNGDALYQQYKDKYIQQGKMAMQDTMGQAAALTGGYSNSYATTAGNQAYQAHLNNLNDIIPELQQMAYDRYNQEGQDLYNQYTMAMNNYSAKYGEWSDSMTQYNADRQHLYGVYDALYNRDYNAYRDAITDEQWKAAMDYQTGRDETEDEQWQKIYDAQYGNAGGGSASGGGSGSGSGSGSSGDNSYDNQGFTSIEVCGAQSLIGVKADGMWGADSDAAAKAKGYNSLGEVVAAVMGIPANKGGSDVSLEDVGKTANGTSNIAWGNFDMLEHNEIVKENGGSYYSTVLADLKTMKSAGKSTTEASKFLLEAYNNSYITYSEYFTLCNKYRDNRL